MVCYTHHWHTLCRIWHPKVQMAKAQSDVVSHTGWNVHMFCQHESNVAYMFRLPSDEEYVKRTGIRDGPLHNGQSMQISKRTTSYMQPAPGNEAPNAHGQRLCRVDHTAQHSAVDWPIFTHILGYPPCGSDCARFTSRCRNDRPPPAPPLRGSECLAFSCHNQDI